MTRKGAFHERNVWPLTSESGCYTGIRDKDLHFATSFHTCKLDLSSSDLACSEITKSSDESLSCVGYSRLGSYECIAMLDKRRLYADDPQSRVAGEQQSVWSIARQQEPTEHFDIINEAVSQLNMPPLKISGDVCLLIVRRWDGKDLAEELSVALPFRPLTPTLVCFKDDFGLLVGSSDDTELYFYLRGKDGKLEPKTLPQDDVFRFSYSVMSISTLQVDNQHCFVISCQDGSIRVLLVGINVDGELEVHSSDEAMVDGPLICTYLRQTDAETLHILAGSMYGYVMSMSFDMSKAALGSPFVVAEKFWNAPFNSEDPITAVSSYDNANAVCVGTQSGQVALCSADSAASTVGTGEGYKLEWQCQLPYSVNGISMVDNGQLVVSTRRSVHVFVRSPVTAATERAIRIKNKVEEMLQPLQPEKRQIIK